MGNDYKKLERLKTAVLSSCSIIGIMLLILVVIAIFIPSQNLLNLYSSRYYIIAVFISITAGNYLNKRN
ncbi:hypothetical protein WKT02_10450 [Erysipelotrichaceae bacterium HCN-30851]